MSTTISVFCRTRSMETTMNVHRVLCVKLISLANFSCFVYVMENDFFVHMTVHKRGAANFCKDLLSAQECLHCVAAML